MFEDGSEVFYGEAMPEYDPDARLFVRAGRFNMRGETSGLVCAGRTAITFVPADNTCRGQKGKVTAHCDDKRSLEAAWSASSCKSGSGEGHDDHGTAFAFTFGVPARKAIEFIERRLGIHKRRPAWPPPDHSK